ncbi:MAG: DUF938 domain-containing protein [Sneathiella sp.]|nr:DUF938 domain-containing protein [Sneathiella sp.]
MTEDRRIFALATARNRDAIYRILKEELPKSGTVLELASGSGEHGAFFAPLFPSLQWQPSNLDEEQLGSTRAWQKFVGADNFLDALKLDATANPWPVEQDYAHEPITAVFNANMIHISPWRVCQGLMAGAGRVLKSGGRLFLYGPFKVGGFHTSESNVQFETWLTNQSPEFGVRDVEKVKAEAALNGLIHIESCPMPANNFIQIFEKN